MAKHPFVAQLARGPLLCDGAMGTRLFARGVPMHACLEALNLEEPERILAVHREYLAAGAQVIETNTFGANRHRLAQHDLAAQVREINLAAATLAGRACAESGRPAFVAGSIGPLGYPLLPDEAVASFREQAEALLEGGIDVFMVETITTVAEMRAALTAIRPISDLPLVAQITFGPDGRTRDGADPATAAREMQSLGADVVGANCGTGPAHIAAVIHAMHAACDLPLAAQPSAGLPAPTAAGLRYPGTPESFAGAITPLVAHGVRLLGGCCGTTPAHISALATVRDNA